MLDQKQLLTMFLNGTPETPKSKYLFIVPSADIAQAIIEAEGGIHRAIGVNSIETEKVHNTESLTQYLADQILKGNNWNAYVYVPLLGKESNERLYKFFDESYGFKYKRDAWKYFKDLEAIADNEAQLKKALNNYIARFETQTAAAYMTTAKHFIENDMKSQIEAYKNGSIVKTGFSSLDKKAGNIQKGLYVIGAISSLGKTTFIHQIADQVAEQGCPVLYFSLEQSTLELISKSLSRRTAKKNYDTAVTSLQIRNGMNTQAVKEATEEYCKAVGDNLTIVEGNFNCNAEYVEEVIKDYIDETKQQPLVIIDYLQIMTAPGDLKAGDTKSIVDANITRLKKISRNLGVTMIVISSFNRDNYLQTADYSSFKESGAIEYTADVIWALQLSCLTEDKETFGDDAKKNITKKRERVAAEKTKLPRDIRLVCLKNRYGQSDYTEDFKYYPNYDLFCGRHDWNPVTPDTPYEKKPIRKPI